MKSSYLRIVSLLVCILALARADAQEIHGTVTDPSGAVVSGATVRLSEGDQVIATTHTDRQGNYNVRSQAECSSCELTVLASGFVSRAVPVHLRKGEHLTIEVHLEVATIAEEISIDARPQAHREQLDLSEVRESAAKDVGEALAGIDGVYKIRKAGVANDVVVRGFQQNNIGVLIDGARIYGACPGHMDPAVQHADFAEVERVELVKGPFDVHSSGNLGASVNVITKSPPLGLRVTPSISTGSFGFYNPNVTASLGKPSFRVLAGYSYRVSDPFKDGSGVAFTDLAKAHTGDPAKDRVYASGISERSFDIHTGWFETEFSPTEHQKVSLSYTRQQSGTILYPYLTMDSDYDNADRVSVKYEVRDIGSSVRALRIQAYSSQVVHFMSDRYRTSAMGGSWMMASNARSRVFGGRLEADLGRDLMVGMESYFRNWNMMGYMRQPTMTMAVPSLPDVGTMASGVFVDYRRHFTDKLRLNGGARFDHDSMEVGRSDVNTDGWYKYQNTRSTRSTDNYASGNMRLSYRARSGLDLYAGAGTAGRVPDAQERYLNRAMKANVGNPGLPIVRNTEVSAGVILYQGGSYLKPSLFYSRIDDYILVNNQPLLNAVGGTSAPFARSYTNVQARIYGGEISYSLDLPASFSLTGGGSYSKGVNDRKPEAGVLDSNLPEMPPLRTWTALRYVRGVMWGEIGATGVNRQNLVSNDLKESVTPGYGLMNLKLGVAYRKLFATLAVDNLLNRYYVEHLSYYRDPFASGVRVPEPGRNVFLQVKYAF